MSENLSQRENYKNAKYCDVKQKVENQKEFIYFVSDNAVIRSDFAVKLEDTR